jgi:hypothetical protein
MRNAITVQAIHQAQRRSHDAMTDLAFHLRVSGRKVRLEALKRLVRYWASRTPFTTAQICQVMLEYLQGGDPFVSLRKHGWT